MSAPEPVTQILAEWGAGDAAAFDRLFPIVYDDLSAIAHGKLARSRPGHTLNTQALVHESYIKLIDGSKVGWRDRSHFFAVAGRAMRQVLIDHARKWKAGKRGGGQRPVTFDESVGPGAPGARLDQLLAVDEALRALEAHDERLARVVECRYFAGLTAAETAEAMGSSLRTVERDWTRARAYLKDALQD